MKISVTVSCAVAIVLAGCSGSKIRSAQRQSNSSMYSANWVKNIRQNVYEVVIPKLEDTDIKYERPLPYEKLSYKERMDKFISIGTAFSIENEKFISAAHVISLHSKLVNRTYYLRDVNGKVFKIKDVLRYSMAHDLIEFSLEEAPESQTVLSVSKIPDIGEVVYTFGNAQGEGISIRGGQVANLTPESEDGRWNNIRFSAPASPGNSGGPLLNSNGEVVGVVTMKNSSENLNYAIPIGELFKLPEEKAIFQQKNVPISLFSKVSNNSIDFSLELPGSFQDLNVEAHEEMQRSFKSFFAKFFEEHEKTLFPYGPGSQEYLRNQSYLMQLAPVIPEAAGKWGLQKTDYKSVSLGGDRVLWIRSEGNVMSMNIPKPDNVSLEEFLDNPGLVLDQVFQIGNVMRQVGEEKVRMLSYSAPHEKKFFIDELGRPGFDATWRHLYSMKTSTLSCMAVPTGASCAFAETPTSHETAMSSQLSSYLSKLTNLSYTGNMKQWKEFLELDHKYLPRVFHDSSFSFVSKKSLKYEFGKIAVNFVPTHDFDDTSIMSVKVGYALNLPLTQEVHGVNLKPRGDKGTLYTAGLNFKPSDDMNSDMKKRWTDIVQGNRPFNGQIFNHNGTKTALFPRVAHTRDVANESVGFDRAYIGGCFGDSAALEEEMKEDCAKFIDGLKFFK